PDGDRALIGAGVGARLRWFTVDAGYLAAVATELFGATGSFAARYRSVTHTVSVALTFRLANVLARD
ncbi:MAG TPA: hypothetical protein VGL86_00830, partial [Polyangia bacterium]